MLLSLTDHPLDLVLGQRGAARDRHGLLLAGAPILGGDVDDAVGVDVKGDLDLRHATGSRCDAGQLESAQTLVVLGYLALTLEHLDEDRWLVVVGGGEHLRTFGRYGRIALDELSHQPTLGLDAQRQGGYVDEKDVLAFTLEDPGLQARANRHDLVGIDSLVGDLAAGELGDDIGHGRHTSRPADQDHVGNLADVDAGVLDDLAERALGPIEQVRGELLELRAGHGLVQVDRAILGHREVLQVDVGARRSGELLLGLLGRVTQTLHGDLVVGQVDPAGVLHDRDQVLDDALVPVVTTELVVTVGRADLDGGEAVLRVLADLK